MAVADVDCDVTLHAATAARSEEAVAVSAQTSVSRRHVEAEGARVEHIDERRTAAVTIDRFIDAHDIATVDLVKLDVEGAEPLVLAGMTETIRRHRPDMVCEVLYTEAGRAVEAVLAPCGYSWSQLTCAGPVAREHIAPVGSGVWPNYLLTCSD